MPLNINYKDDIESIEKDLRNSVVVKIDGKDYKELINVMYTIPYEPDILKIEEKPHTQDDFKERQYLLKRLNECFDILKKDQNSRRAVYCNLYWNNLAKCISLVHLLIRNNKLYINEYYRSQEFMRNGLYDMQTAIMLMQKGIQALNVEPGIITVFVANLHMTYE